MRKSAEHRSQFPKIREQKIKGQALFVVDARRTGTLGKKRYFVDLGEAEKHADDVAATVARNGQEGLDLDPETRGMVAEAQRALKPHGATILDAVRHYTAWLAQQKAREATPTIGELAEKWHQVKAKGGLKKLRPKTVADIKETSERLTKSWGGLRPEELTPSAALAYLEGLEVSHQRKFNIRNLNSQFFNWCIKREITAHNPFSKVEVEMPEREEPLALSPDDAEKLMRTCQSKFAELVPYHAVCLFAGMRPYEVLRLKWEDINIEEAAIFVRKSSSKVKESRLVQMEDNLVAWLKASKGTGEVVGANHRDRCEQLRIALGYKLQGENPEGPEWVDDVMRHSYASYWLAKHKNREHLAEQMGTSLKMIKARYKKTVSLGLAKKFWGIMPQATGPRGAEREPDYLAERDRKLYDYQSPSEELMD